MSKNSFENLNEHWDSNSIFYKLVVFQYFACFFVLFILQILTTVNRTRQKPFVNKKFFTALMAAIKILFAPGIFIVTVIDYDRLCIYQSVGTFFLDIAFYANFCLVLIIICPILSCFCKDNEGCFESIVKTSACVYICCSFILYFGIYFGPWVAKIENFIATFALIVEGVELVSIERASKDSLDSTNKVSKDIDLTNI